MQNYMIFYSETSSLSQPRSSLILSGREKERGLSIITSNITSQPREVGAQFQRLLPLPTCSTCEEQAKKILFDQKFLIK